MATNHLGQQTTDSGHVITESERVEDELSNTTKYGVIGPEAKKDLVKFIMDYAHIDWSKNVRHGVQLGRKDARVMLTALLNKAIPVLHVADEKTKKVYSETPSNAIPVTELKKVITALQEGQA